MQNRTYEPSKKVIGDLKAENLLRTSLTSSVIYKEAEDFAYGKDTYYVESFNNVLNMYEDKRISFSSKEYGKGAYLAVLHWNENVDKGYTSEWQKPAVANKRRATKKNYKEATCEFSKYIWKNFLDKLIT